MATAVLLLLAVVLPQPAAGEEPSAAGLGWQGQRLPEGLRLGEQRNEYVWERDGAVMVYVPPGASRMGSDEGALDERPAREVHLDGFYIDKHEVSFARWRASGLPMPPEPSWGSPDEHPVVNVSWNEVQAYLAWAGKRLPSEAEWEKAARGTDGRRYPWGDEAPREDRAIWKYHPVARESTAPVDCCSPGASPYGVLNLAGNVYEWCEDYYDADFYARAPKHNPVNRERSRYRVLRGGAFIYDVDYLRAAFRYRLLPRDRTPYIGFRTVISGVATD